MSSSSVSSSLPKISSLFDFDVVNDAVVPGDTFSYVISIANTMPATQMTNAEVSITLPAGVSFNRFANSGYFDSTGHTGCNASGGCDAGDTAIWAVDTLAPGQSITFHVRATVAANVDSDTSITTEAQFTSDQLSSPIMTMRSVHVQPELVAHFALTASKDPVAIGEPFHYWVDFSNTSNDPITNAELALMLPAGVSIIDANGAEVAGNTATWMVDSLTPTLALQRGIEVMVDPSIADVALGTVLTAYAELTHDDGPAVDQMASVAVSVSEPLPLALSVDLIDSPLVAGGLASYAITLSNTQTNSVLEDVYLQLTLPEGLTFNRFSDVAGLDSTGHSGCNAAGGCNASDEVRWQLEQLAAGESVTLHIDGVVNGMLPLGSLMVLPVFAGAADLGDSIVLAHAAPLVAAPSVHVSLTPSHEPITVGDSLTLSVVLSNPTNDALTNLTAKLQLPPALVVDSVSDDGMNEGKMVTWPLETLNPTAAVTRTVMVTLEDDLPVGSILESMVAVTHDDGLELDARATAAITVADTAPLAVDYELLADPVIAGGTMTYAITMSNLSETALVENLFLQVNVPEGVSFNRFADVAYLDSTGHRECNAAGGCSGGGEVYWQIPQLAAGESITVHIDAAVADTLDIGTRLRAPIFIRADDMADVIALQRTAIVAASATAHLQLTPSKDPVAAGEVFDYTLHIGSSGNRALENTKVSLELPEGVMVNSIAGMGEQSGRVITWDLADVNPTEALARSVNVTAPSDAPEGMILSASAQLIYDGGLEVDKQVTAAVTISPPPFLEVEYELLSTPVVAGGLLSYAITLSNTSIASVVSDIGLQITVSDFVAFNRFSDVAYLDSTAHRGCNAAGGCTPSDEVYWQVPTLAAGESVTIHIEAGVSAEAAAGTVIRAPVYVVAEGLGDVIALQRTAEVVTAQPVQLALTPSKDPVGAGEAFAYRLSLSNQGSKALESGELELMLPAGVTVVDAAGGEQTGQMIHWALDDIAPANLIERTVQVMASDDLAPGTALTAKAMVRFTGGLEVDSWVSGTVTSAPKPLLAVSYELLEAPVVAGGELTYAITLANTSVASKVSNIGVQLTVPAWVAFNRLRDVAYLDSSGHRGCNAAGGCDSGDEVYWQIDELAAGSSVTIHINATVAAEAPQGTIIRTPIYVVADELEEVIALQRVAAVIASQPAKLALMPLADPVAAGDVFQYQVAVGNTGNNLLPGASLTLQLPAALSAGAISDDGAMAGELITWSIGDIAGGQTLARTVELTASDELATGQPLTAFARLMHGAATLDPVVSSTLTVNQDVLTATLSMASEVTAGGALTGTITLTNTAVNAVARNVSVQLNLPAHTSFDAIDDATPSSTSRYQCNSAAGCNAGAEVFWAFDEIAAGDSQTISFTLAVGAAASVGELIEPFIYVRADGQADDIVVNDVTVVIAP